MNEERADHATVVPPDHETPKRPWHAPVLEEIDVLDTQAGTVYAPPADFTNYRT